MSSYTITKKLNPNKVFILQKSELEKRFDPQYYQKEYKNIVNKLKENKHSKLGEIVKFSKETWNQKDFFNDTFPYIEISEIDTLSGEIQNISNIELSNAASRAKMIVRENDIIVSTTRPNRGAIALINKEQDFSIASTGFCVIRDSAIDKNYLFAILKQNFILKQFEQRSSGGNYPAITQEELSSVIIPIAENDKQIQIKTIFQECFKQKKINEEKAEKLLESIDTYLLNQLGIVLPEKEENTLKSRMFTTSISELSGSRFDPNFNNLNHQTNITSIKNSKYKVENLKQITTQIFQGVGRNIDETSQFKLLKVKNIKRNCEIDYDEIEQIGIFSKDKILQKNDIITPCIGEAIRQIKFAVFEKDSNLYLVDNNVGVIRPNERVNSMYLNYCLCNSIGRLQINRLIGGGGVPFLGSDNLKKFIVPLPPFEKQNEIAEHISEIRKQAQDLKDQTKLLLEKANKEIEDILLNT